MKIYKNLFRILSVAAFMMLMISSVACSKNKEGEETKVEGPQYQITVTQGQVKLGDIIVELFPDVAPEHCRNFDSLVAAKFYDGTAFHRVIPGFMIQGGDPNSKDKPRNKWGQGDPSQRMIKAEFNKKSHKRGILSAARRGGDNNSATSQFFIMVNDAPHLDGQYTVYGHVLTGMEIADKIVNSKRDAGDNPIEKIEMKITKIK